LRVSRFSDPGLTVQDYHLDLLIDLLNRRPNLPVDEHPEWFDDRFPEHYLELVDLGLIDGITYNIGSGGQLSIDLDREVTLTDKGRRLAEAARRASKLARVFVSYVRDDLDEVNTLCGAWKVPA
jgi:hypothetical protein